MSIRQDNALEALGAIVEKIMPTKELRIERVPVYSDDGSYVIETTIIPWVPEEGETVVINGVPCLVIESSKTPKSVHCTPLASLPARAEADIRVIEAFSGEKVCIPTSSKRGHLRPIGDVLRNLAHVMRTASNVRVRWFMDGADRRTNEDAWDPDNITSHVYRPY